MRLWTIQHKAAYDKLLETGSLRANEAYLFCQDDFRFAYDWLSEQMTLRIGPPPEGVSYPVWAWYQWEGQRKRPDMRKNRKGTSKGAPIVLLTVEVPEQLVLLSDFDMWNGILCNAYLSLRGHDEPEEYTPEEKRKSWENVFAWDAETDYWSASKSTQATLWEIRKEWLIKAEYFISG